MTTMLVFPTYQISLFTHSSLRCRERATVHPLYPIVIYTQHHPLALWLYYLSQLCERAVAWLYVEGDNLLHAIRSELIMQCPFLLGATLLCQNNLVQTGKGYYSPGRVPSGTSNNQTSFEPGSPEQGQGLVIHTQVGSSGVGAASATATKTAVTTTMARVSRIMCRAV